MRSKTASAMLRVAACLAASALALAILTASAAATHDRLALGASAATSPQVALDWDNYAVNAVRAALTTDGVPPGGSPRSFYQIEGLVYMSYVQAAVYDAVTKIDHRYRPYHSIDAAGSGASLPAAVVSAAYSTLVHYLGDSSGTLAAEYAASIGALPADDPTARGIAVGQAAAADVEQLRAGDGLDATTAVFGAPFVYDASTAGVWQVVPPFVAVGAQTPWVAFMRPFTLESPSQFRVPPPPALGSAQYAADFNETKAFGSSTSSVRTPDETAVAQFWNANVINQDNQLYRDLAVQHGLDLVDTVHLMAMGTLTVTDAGIACFDSKYTYLRWRPYSAIRNADLDGNAATAADPAWLPLLSTPNHPEYPAAHGCLTSALADVLAQALGTPNIDATFWGSTGGATTLSVQRAYATTQQLKDEIVNARVWAGLHWRTSVVAGEDLGDDVAGWTLARFFGSRSPDANCPAAGATVIGSLDVPAASYCDLENVTVRGNVTLEDGSSFSADGGRIGGNVQTQGGDLQLSSTSVGGNLQSQGGAVDVRGTSVGGNLQIGQGTGEATVCESQIRGNLELEQSSESADLCGNRVGGNVQIQDNLGAVSVTGNTVGGNVQCQNNAPAATSSGNAIRGRAQGECLS